MTPKGLEQYSIVASRRPPGDSLLWQVPTMALTGEAFLFTISLGGSHIAGRTDCRIGSRAHCGPSLAPLVGRPSHLRADRRGVVTRTRAGSRGERDPRTAMAGPASEGRDRPASIPQPYRPHSRSPLRTSLNPSLVLDHVVDLVDRPSSADYLGGSSPASEPLVLSHRTRRAGPAVSVRHMTSLEGQFECFGQ